MRQLSAFYQKNKNVIVNWIFPILLFLYPFMKVNQGVDVSDSTYSLGNYLFFPELSGMWVISTYLSNVVGFFLTKLPLGATLLGFNFYSGILVSSLVLLTYLLLRRWMPAWIAFVGEMIAIGFLWIPTGILYNYLTYFLFTLAALFIYKGLVEEKNLYLGIAGICLGANVWVRIPNLTEMALIIAVWYYLYLFSKDRKEDQKTNRNRFFRVNGICIGGYLIGLVLPLIAVLIQYGSAGIFDMISGLSGIQGSDDSYSIWSMIMATLKAYGRSSKWLLLLLLGICLGMTMFVVLKDRFVRIKKLFYLLGLIVLVRFYWGRGMFSFRYYEDYSSIYEWGMLGLFLSFFACMYLLVAKDVSRNERLFGMISLIILVITPLGSNNYTYQNLNNLFLVAPVTVYAFTKLCRRNIKERYRGISFVWKSSVALILFMILIQSFGFHSEFVFRDGMDGSKRNTMMTENKAVRLMYTTEENAETLGGLIEFFEKDSEKKSEKKCIYMGDCPGLSFILQRESALSTSWMDLDSEAVEKIAGDLKVIEEKKDFPYIIIRQTETKSKSYQEKSELIWNFMKKYQYQQLYKNDSYQLYDIKKGNEVVK